MAAAFIDGEAEVSDDEDMSGDEDGEDDDMLSDLIDDETQPFGSVQPKKYRSGASILPALWPALRSGLLLP